VSCVAPQPRQPVRGAGRRQLSLCIGIGLHVDLRDLEAKPLELASGRAEVTHEETHVVEKDLVALRQLPVDQHSVTEHHAVLLR
jgi:hypothetical protein